MRLPTEARTLCPQQKQKGRRKFAGPVEQTALLACCAAQAGCWKSRNWCHSL